MISQRIRLWITRRPPVTRAFLSVLRKQGQVVRFGGSYIALGHSAVVEILTNTRDFTVREANKSGFATGPVLLYMDDGAVYRNDKLALDRAFCPRLYQNLTDDTRKMVSEKLNQTTGTKLDLVADFAEPIVTRMIAEHFFGFEPTPSELTKLRGHLRVMGATLIDGNVSAETERAAAEVVRIIKANPIRPHAFDLVNQLRNTDPEITCLSGTAAGLALAAAATVSRGLGQTVDNLLKRPDVLQAATDAVLNQNSSASELVDQIVRESLRFAPVLVFIRRHTERDTLLSPTSGGLLIPRGSAVAVSLASAMFDESVFPNAKDFRLDRPRESYLHFGHGLHHCYGSKLAEMFMREMIIGLLKEQILIGAKTHRSEFDSWALTKYQISMAGARNV